MERKPKVDKYIGNELNYIQKVLNGEGGKHGTWVKSLETSFANKFGTKYAVAMNSGTATLHASLKALGVGYGDEVICPSLTVIMDTTTVLQCNAVPVYADINPDTFIIDINDVERKITNKTKAIIVVSLYGLPVDMDAFNGLSQKYNIPIIEDNAQCFLGKINGKICSCSNAFSSWSFETTKHISCGEGGILATNDEKLAVLARKVGGHGYKNLSSDGGVIKFNDEQSNDVKQPSYKRHDSFGINYRLNEFSAAIALAQLEDLEEKVIKRQKVAEIFLDIISSFDKLQPQKIDSKFEHAFFTLGVKYAVDSEDEWLKFRDKYIELGGDSFYAAWSVSYLEPLMKNREYVKICPPVYDSVRYNKGDCPVAEHVQRQMMQFKTNYRSLEEAKQQANILKQTINYFR